MIVISGTVVELNTYEQAAAVSINFPFNRFKMRRVGNHGHIRVTFYSAAQCDMWKRRIMDAMPADTSTAYATG